MTKRSMCSCANQYRYPSDTWTESQLPTSLTDEIYIYSRQILIERKKNTGVNNRRGRESEKLAAISPSFSPLISHRPGKGELRRTHILG